MAPFALQGIISEVTSLIVNSFTRHSFKSVAGITFFCLGFPS